MNERGFTLLEVVTYLALCGLLFGGLVPVAYELVRAADRNSSMASAMNEAALIDRTLYWAIADAKVVTVPAPDTLLVTKNDGETVRFATDGASFTVTRGNDAATTLNITFPVTLAAFAVSEIGENGFNAATAAFSLGPSRFSLRYPLPQRGMFPSSCLRQ